MRMHVSLLVLTAALLAPSVWAQDDVSSRTERRADEIGGTMKDEKFAVRPQAGVLVYKDQAANSTSRFLAGLTMDWNIASMITPEGSPLYIGPSTGALFSHIGAADSNFFGTESTVTGNEGANFLLVPLNAKVGYNVSDAFRVAVHGGGNLTYRSIPSTMIIGTDTASKTKVFPNAGADLEWGLGGVALGLRPDVTFGTEEPLFTGSLMVAIPLA